MVKKVSKPPQKSRSSGPQALEDGLKACSSNLYSELISNASETRFLKVTCKGENDWLAILGSYAPDGTPIVCFGNGHSFTSAMFSLGSSIAGEKWKGDQYAK